MLSRFLGGHYHRPYKLNQVYMDQHSSKIKYKPEHYLGLLTQDCIQQLIGTVISHIALVITPTTAAARYVRPATEGSALIVLVMSFFHKPQLL